MPTTYAIPNGATVFAASTYTGTGSSYSVTNGGNNPLGITFKPDFVWVKERSQIQDHALFDSVRGATKQLSSNTTGAEATYANSLSAFNSNGFTVVSDAVVNSSGQTYVGWQWQAGQGTTTTIAAGSISSGVPSIASTVSVNATAGFSVVTYTGTSTGNGDNKTVGHGLDVAPKFVIVKARTGGAENWYCWHTGLTSGTYYVVLNSAAGQTNDNTRFYQAPSPSLLYLGGNTGVSATGYTYVAYCWAAIAGYSAFGTYTGNQAADGPFVYLGFRPRWVMVKRSDSTGFDWIIGDSSRNTYNVVNGRLLADGSIAEDTSDNWVDFNSNGFKIRSSNTNQNASNGTYIYAAFAENPFKYANAR